MFESVLIANRGEIACRIVRTARRMGLRTVAVYSEADADALHVAMADEARLIGPAPAAESYLDIDAVLAAAAKSGAEAIHPGYGFLAENAEFAEACGRAGLLFVGPPADAIRAMGSKSAAKEIMEKAGVALVPGYHGAGQGEKMLAKEAGKIGYPVLIKASAGGGGKGMRVVEKPAGFADALKSAKREAKSSFGDDRVLIEKYLARPRHIEVQIFADGDGNAVHLFERDCSIQRRHQKIVEEAPAPGMTAARRAEMGAAAVAASRAIGYVGAGTVEFLADGDGAFYFMEMNTRLQVEHPVTEMITGHDLVEWQFRVAAGESLPRAQDELAIDGHAIEVRLYAEDPANDFLPATGTLSHLRLPEEGRHVRVDSGVRQRDGVGIHYDPLLAKLVVWDRDRGAALGQLRRALAGCEIAGLANNVSFLSAIAAHPVFAAGDADTGFIARHLAELLAAGGAEPDIVLATAALSEVLREASEADAAARESADPYSPWHRRDGWRLNDDAHHVLRFRDGDQETAVTVHYRDGHYLMDLPGGTAAVRGEFDADGAMIAEIAGSRVRATAVRQGEALTIFVRGFSHNLIVVDRLAASAAHDAGAGRLTAPMPGKIIEIMTDDGAAVEAGTPLLVLEAMKMEHTITAPAAGTVRRVCFAVGDQVEEGAELVEIEEGDAP